MKEKSEIEREIVSRVRREMDKPRLTQSVLNGLSVQAAPSMGVVGFRDEAAHAALKEVIPRKCSEPMIREHGSELNFERP